MSCRRLLLSFMLSCFLAQTVTAQPDTSQAGAGQKPQITDLDQLLQSVRDEAHRFAQHYHHLLRSKSQFR